jgi:uncharacterized protein with HEPN domain
VIGTKVISSREAGTMRAYKLYLYDIIRLIDAINGLVKGATCDGFAHDFDSVNRVVRRLVLLREKSANLPKAVRDPSFNIDWDTITGRIDPGTGKYLGYDIAYQWEIIGKKLPLMRARAEEFLEAPDLTHP